MILHLKGTVSIISSYFSRKDCNNWFTMVSLKALSDQVWIRYQIFYFENWLFLTVDSLQKWLARISTEGKHEGFITIKHFKSRKTTSSTSPQSKSWMIRADLPYMQSFALSIVRLPSEESTQHVLCNKCTLARSQCRVNWVLHYSPFKPLALRQSQRFILRR